jgi:hypothetical protein
MIDVLCVGILLAALIADPTAFFFFGGVEPVERERERERERENTRQVRYLCFSNCIFSFQFKNRTTKVQQ